MCPPRTQHWSGACEAPPGCRKEQVRCFKHPVLSSGYPCPLSTLLSEGEINSLGFRVLADSHRCGCELCHLPQAVLIPDFCLPLLQPPCPGSGSRRSIFTSQQECSLGAELALGSQLRKGSKATSATFRMGAPSLLCSSLAQEHPVTPSSDSRPGKAASG